MDVGGLSGVLEIVRDHGHGLALHAGVAGNSPARVHRAPEAATVPQTKVPGRDGPSPLVGAFRLTEHESESSIDLEVRPWRRLST
jgi:hypothetical protein